MDGAGGFSLREYAESPLLAFRICMEKDNYATTCTTRLTFSGNLPANSELCMWVFHQRVVELTYGDEPAPIKVLPARPYSTHWEVLLCMARHDVRTTGEGARPSGCARG